MPSTADLLDLRGVTNRSTSYRFDLLDREEVLIGTVHPHAIEATPTITHDTSRSAARDISSFNLDPGEAAEVDVMSDRIRPVMVLGNGDEYPLGVYLFADVVNPIFSYGEPVAATLIDKGLIIDQAMEKSVTVNRGAEVRSVILALLSDVAIDVIMDSTVAQSDPIGAPMAWPAGTTRTTVITDLCRLVSLNPPWFDHDGICRIDRVDEDIDQSEATVVYADGLNIYAASPVLTNDMLHAVNRTIAISTDSTTAAFIGIYDVPASAPHSFYARGYRISEVINLQGIASQGAIDAAAKSYATTGSRKGTFVEHVSFSGPPDPRHNGYDVIEFRGSNWQEETWSLPLTSFGPMTHTLRRSVA